MHVASRGDVDLGDDGPVGEVFPQGLRVDLCSANDEGLVRRDLWIGAGSRSCSNCSAQARRGLYAGRKPGRITGDYDCSAAR